MKKYCFYILALVLSLSSCKDMDSQYKDFVVPNGYTYPQKADSLKIYPGFNKLRLTWMRPKSPTVKYSMVYWNNYQDSMKVDLPENVDTLRILLEDLLESSYTIYIKNFDQLGNESIQVEGTGTPYGENFLVGSTDRSYLTATRNIENVGTINWGAKTSNLLYTEVRYTTNSNVVKTVRVLPTETVTTLTDVKPKVPFEYRSKFLPPRGIDTVTREWKTSDAAFLIKFPRDTWTAETKNGHHDWGDGGGGQPFLLFDGKQNTGWHSKVGTPFPQVVVVDMKESLDISQVVIDPPTQTNWRYLKNVEVYISDTPLPAAAPDASWGTPATKVTYANQSSFAIDIPGAKKGRYVALVFLDGTQPYISFMEFHAFGY